MVEMMHLLSGSINTSDHVGLNFLEKGFGRPLVLIPGWSQTAAMFHNQVEDLSQDYRVIAIDMRGHGDSEKPSHGYRVARLAIDLHEVLQAFDLENVSLAGHSMGCSVIWSYWEQFGNDRLSRLILIDQAPAVTSWPAWTEEEKAHCGSIFTAQELFDTAAQFAGPRGESQTKFFISRKFFTESAPRSLVRWVIKENLKFPRIHAAHLLLDHGVQDWRDLIKRITLPTLVVGGAASIFNPASQNWISRQIPDARVEIFSKDEGGSHFMWLENPAKFNRLVRSFMG